MDGDENAGGSHLEFLSKLKDPVLEVRDRCLLGVAWCCDSEVVAGDLGQARAERLADSDDGLDPGRRELVGVRR
ncbi:MAG: hypothetical protein QOD83_3270 [Solirubrobacteraceae bacterium]|nr:hypothetical protein [Solirubrobacteraceae bacterium]